MRTLVAVALLLLWAAPGPVSCADGPAPARPPVSSKPLKLWSEAEKGYVHLPPVVLPEAEWKQKLTPEQFHVIREAGTERAFTGALLKEHRHGVYHCAACGTDLFRSETKFDSGTGWPSFHSPIAKENVELRSDRSWRNVERIEVRCRRCGAHLGHVFDDGPPPTGKRYCMNSASLTFSPR